MKMYRSPGCTLSVYYREDIIMQCFRSLVMAIV
uniref:Uncharacterized protein n=1 Tax=Anguilla anguilla TaxID=7936 RepID=A0A0E9R2F8_ANGAN